MRAVVWTELRRSTLTLGLLVIAFAQVWLMFNDVDAWRGVWPMASAAIGAQWLFLGPAVAGLSALDAGYRQRCRSGELATDTFGWRRELTAMLISRVILVCGVLFVAAGFAVAVNLASGAPAGFLWPSYLVLAVAYAIECVALGMLLGSFGGPLWFAPLLAVLMVFLRGVTYSSPGVGSQESAYSRFFLSGRAWVELSPVAVATAVLEAVVVVALALVVPGAVSRFRARKAGRVYPLGTTGALRMAAGSIALAIGLLVVLNGPIMLEDRRLSADPLCSHQASLKVCVWPENAVYLPALTEVATRAEIVASAVGGATMTETKEFGLGPGNSFIGLGQGTWFFSDHLAGSIASSLSPPPQCDYSPEDPKGDAYYRALFELSALFQLQIEQKPFPSGYGTSNGIDLAGIEKVWRGDAAAREDWIKGKVSTMDALVTGLCG